MQLGTEKKGVHYLEADHPSGFEAQYLAIRKKEKRVLTDAQVAQLPHLKNHPLSKEWALRAESCQRFIAYQQSVQPQSVLEIGCGNGWFSHQISCALPRAQVVGQDINIVELEQAGSVFDAPNLKWVYCANLSKLPPHSFDLIVFNASIQYFGQIKSLMEQLSLLLTPNGEVHVLDSPLYSDQTEAQAAENRSKRYYEEQGHPVLASFYHHHTPLGLPIKQFHFKPSKWQRLLGNRNPFPWFQLQLE